MSEIFDILMPKREMHTHVRKNHAQKKQNKKHATSKKKICIFIADFISPCFCFVFVSYLPELRVAIAFKLLELHARKLRRQAAIINLNRRENLRSHNISNDVCVHMWLSV